MEWSLLWLALFSIFCCPHVLFCSNVVYCEDRLLGFLTEYSVSVHDGCGRGPVISMLSICFVEDKHGRKSLTGQITLYYLKRDPYAKHSFFSETQKL